ncbi:MAG: hypothetical protein ACRD2Y_12990 [Terriglobales bacterium]
MVANAQAFRHFVQTQFQLSHWAARQRDDARRQPQITAAFIFRALVYQAVLCLDSLLSVDQWLRSPQARRLLEHTGRRSGSDTTLLRALGAWQLWRSRQAGYALHLWLRDQGWATRTLASGRRVKPAVVDGSCFGGMWAVALGFAGRVWQTVDVVRTHGRGHELAGARRVLGRARQRLGPGFATHVLYDGLMAVRKDFERARLQWDTHLVVKTTEESLEVVQSCRAAWCALADEALRALGVEVARGVDVERMVEYVVCAQSGIRWDGLAWPLVVAWVRETPLKGKRAGQTEECWVLSSDESLRAEELRELAHLRWAIENQGFKTLNASVGSKRAYLKDDHAREALLLIESLGLALVGAFEVWLTQQKGWRGWGVKKTRRWLGRCVEWTALEDEVLGCGGSP